MALSISLLNQRALNLLAEITTILLNPHFAQFYVFYYLFPLPFLFGDWIVSLWFLYFFPFLFYIFYVRVILGRTNLLKLEKKWRKWPFLVNIFSIGCLGLYFFISKDLAWGGKGLVFMLILNFLAFFITLFWRISLHMLGVASVWALYLFYPGFAGNLALAIGGFVLVLLVGWSRLRLNAHTPMQVIVGSLLGFFLTSLFLNYAPI
jgi:membrane-associated phospholipid phosphatase